MDDPSFVKLPVMSGSKEKCMLVIAIKEPQRSLLCLDVMENKSAGKTQSGRIFKTTGKTCP